MSLTSVAMFLVTLLFTAEAQSFSAILEDPENANLSILTQALEAADLTPFFNDPNLEVTLFAPTDKAFVDLLAALNTTLEALVGDSELLTSVLLYHVVEELAFSTDLSDGLILPTLFANNTVTIRIEDVVEIIGIGSTATVTTPDIEAGAGVVHIIDTVLLPFSNEEPEVQEEQEDTTPDDTIVSVASGVEDLSILVEAVIAADLVANLSSPSSQLTVFAPTNAAFENLIQELGVTKDEFLSDKGTLEVLLYHVVPVVAFSNELTNGQELLTLNQEVPLKVVIDGGDVQILAIGSEATVTGADVAAGANVVHVIDTVLLPFAPQTDVQTEDDESPGDAQVLEADESIADVAVNTPSLSSLVSALQAVDLVNALSNSTVPLTVFAPTNAAFEDALALLGMSFEDLAMDKGMLTEILLYHVVPATLFSTDLEDGQELNTLLESESLTIDIEGQDVSVEAVGSVAQIQELNIEAGKGVVHIVDTVLLPFDVEDLVEVLEETEEPGFLERIRDGIVDFFRTVFGFFGIIF